MSNKNIKRERLEPSKSSSTSVLCRNDKKEPIAIIGIGCRFPGAKGTEAFWQLMKNGVDAISEVPRDRYDIDLYYDPTPGASGKVCTRYGGFLEGVDKFDPYFFGISPREAIGMDPQQRLLLEVTWEALEDAGQSPDKLAGSRTGVFVGMTSNDYSQFIEDPDDLDIYFAGGNTLSVLSGRLSYVFGFQGPSMSLDAACSTSLLSVFLACKSLWTHESTMAVAGGVNMILLPIASFSFSRTGMLALDGRCKFGDAKADGFIRSDGAGIVVLKRLSEAQADGDPIYAVIRGGAVNNDGKSGGFLMQPSPIGQEEVLRQAYQDADISPAEVQYVEAHGTGTNVGDPIELKALGKVLSEGRPKDRPCIIGSVKTNIGHTEGAAGIAGLIKVALCMKHSSIPPSLHFHNPNPNIPWEELPLKVQKEFSPWQKEGKLAVAGVSSFGISGTNVHIVLEEAPETRQASNDVREPGKAELFTLSAHAPESLEAMVGSYKEFVSDGGKGRELTLNDICFTANVRRSHHDFRFAAVVHSHDELAERLGAFLQGENRRGLSHGSRLANLRRKLVFVCSPTGSQWQGMGRELFESEPVFRNKIEECGRLFKKWVDWSLIEVLNASEENSRLEEVDVLQPVLFAIHVALSALWRSWGVQPDAVVGHSMGEIGAAHIAGILTLDDAARITCLRSKLVRQRASGRGGMMVIELPADKVENALSELGGRVSLASCNGPTTTVVSGESSTLQELKTELEGRGVFCQMVKVDYASHGTQMEVLRDELIDVLRGIKPSAASVRMLSTVTVEPLAGNECDEHYWMRNLREPVLFLQAVKRLADEGHDTFLELSPHPVLSVALSQTLRHNNKKGTVLPSFRRQEEERSSMLGSVGALYTLGYPVNWSALYPSGNCVELPSYIWQKERYWIADKLSGGGSNRRRSLHGTNSGHPLLAQHIKSAAHSGMHIWEMELGTNLIPYLKDHRVQGTAVLPATAYFEIALAAAQEAFGPGEHVLEDISLKKALYMPEKEVSKVQLVLTSTMYGKATFQLFSQMPGNGQELPWMLHASGSIRLNQTAQTEETQAHESPESIRARHPQSITGERHCQVMDKCGIQYGPAFQGVNQIWGGTGEAIGQISLPETLRSSAKAYMVHPALLDASFQVILGTQLIDNGNSDSKVEPTLYLPIAIDSLTLYNRPSKHDAPFWSHAIQKRNGDSDGKFIEADVYLLDEDGTVLVETLGLKAQRIDAAPKQIGPKSVDEMLYEVKFELKPRDENNQEKEAGDAAAQSPARWLIFSDRRGVGKSLADMLVKRGERCILVSPGKSFKHTYKGTAKERIQINPARIEDFKKLIQTVLVSDETPCRGMVHLWNLDAPLPQETTLDSFESAQDTGGWSLLHLIHSLPEVSRARVPRLWVVTGGTQVIGGEIEGQPVSIAQSPSWGIARVISREHPELYSREVDLSSSPTKEEIRVLFEELWLRDDEDIIAIRGSDRYVARLSRISSDTEEQKVRISTKEQPYKLEVSKAGVLDNLTLRATNRKKPGAGEIEIQVLAAGVNFRDVLIALGLIPPTFGSTLHIGWECAGRVTAVGEGAEEFKVGDEVVAVAPGAFSSHITILASIKGAGYSTAQMRERKIEDFNSTVFLKPSNLSFEEAATVPIVFLTAYHALYKTAMLKKGDRVLIHAAAGGVGQAAIQIAQWIGAEVFATAGSPEKREFLKSQGVKYVMDSRSLDFAEQVIQFTNGEGVDVVLNSLAADYIPKSISTLRPGGKFVEIGKVDILQDNPLGLKQLERNMSFHVVDLGQLFLDRPDISTVLFNEVMELFKKGVFKPLPYKVFPISEAPDALRYLAQAKNIGKVVLSLEEEELSVAPLKETVWFHPYATYLITGGFGGIGLEVAQWMVERGAGYIALVGRSGPASDDALEAIEKMKKERAHIMIARADISDEEQVSNMLKEIRENMPPLKGIVHGAGILDDGILLQLTPERFKKAMAPKVRGAFNLHKLTLNDALDFFLMFSSAASVLGAPGQGNYVAANTFLDVFAHYRRAMGLPALTFNWGYWYGRGMASLPGIGTRLIAQGILPFTPKQGLEAVERAMQQNLIEAVPIYFDWAKSLSLSQKVPPFFSKFVEEVKLSGGFASKVERDDSVRRAIFAAPPEERREMVESFLQEQVAKVLGIPPSRLDRQKSLMNVGLDSLMALELKNRIEGNLAIDLPVTSLIKGASITDLANELLNHFTASSQEADGRDAQAIEETLEDIERLSDEEVSKLLEKKENPIQSAANQGDQ